MIDHSSPQPIRSFGFALGIIVLLGWASAPAWGASLLVNSGTDEPDANPGDGICETASGPGACSLRAAIQEANALSGADIVYLSAGYWTLSIAGIDEDLSATGDLDIHDHLTIIGAGVESTTVDANGLDRVFHIHNINGLYPEPSVTVSDLTITGGDAGVATLPLGGGVFAEAQGELTLERVTLSGNTANQGAGLRLQGGVTTMTWCSIQGNTIANLGIVNPDGEGLYASSGELEIRASSITGNSGANPASAGAHLHDLSDALVVNTTIAGNSANGLRIYNTSAEISQCTIIENGNRGVNFGSFDGTDSLVLGASILYGNIGGSCSIGSGNYTHSGNIDGGDTCSFDSGSLDLVNTDPLLGTNSICGATVCFAPRPGSPAIDMLPITHPYIQWQDQRDARRPMDGNWDGVELYDAGSVESGLVFADGFETGDTYGWL